MREHSEPVLLGGLVVAMLVFVAFAWFNQPKPAEYVPFTPAAAATPTPTPTPGPLSVVFIGDSLTGGTASNSGAGALWPSILEAKAGFVDTLLTVGDAGYVTEDTATPGSTLGTAADDVPVTANVVVFFGGPFDTGASSEAITAAAIAAFAKVVSVAPSASVLVIGPVSLDSSASAALIRTRDAVSSAAAQTGAQFVDPIAAGWFATGTDGLIAADGVHLTDAGENYLAAQIEPLLAPLLTRTAG